MGTVLSDDTAVRISLRPTALPELIAEVAAMFRSTAERGGLELVVDCPAGPEAILADPEAWERIASNLLSNAVRFTQAGRISVATAVAADEFRLTVQDTGIGIPQNMLARIFDRFPQEPSPGARPQEGSGVGLRLVRELATLHGGSVTAESRVGDGTLMTVAMPVHGTTPGQSRPDRAPRPFQVGDLASTFIAEAEAWVGDSGLAGARRLPIQPAARVTQSEADAPVMVVEDNPDMRGLLSALVSSRYRVVQARTGTDAWQAVLAHRPSLIISDVMVPGLDGFSLLRRLRADRRTHDLPVILISARADPDSTASALEAGADDYIVTPFGARELLARVQATLENARIRADAGELKGRMATLEARDRQLRVLLDDLRAAQRRVTVAADQERQRIERDIHDGAQQRLISLRLELGLLGEALERDPAAAVAKLAELRGALDDALEELRDLSHGVYPSLLASDGLYYALLAAARRSPLPVTVKATHLTRAPGSVESAAYFCCLEAIANAAKHAGAGARVRVDLSTQHSQLAFRVRDDGAGFDPRRRRRGSGLINLGDRVEALGGSVGVQSRPGEGTEVTGRIPLP